MKIHTTGYTWKARTSDSFDSDCGFGVPVAGDALSFGFQHHTERSFSEHDTHQ